LAHAHDAYNLITNEYNKNSRGPLSLRIPRESWNNFLSRCIEICKISLCSYGGAFSIEKVVTQKPPSTNSSVRLLPETPPLFGLFLSFQIGDNESCECNISYCFINCLFPFPTSVFDRSWWQCGNSSITSSSDSEEVLIFAFAFILFRWVSLSPDSPTLHNQIVKEKKRSTQDINETVMLWWPPFFTQHVSSSGFTFGFFSLRPLQKPVTRRTQEDVRKKKIYI